MSKNALETQDSDRLPNAWGNPFRELAKMRTDFDRMFDGFFQNRAPASLAPAFAPSCEIKETKKSYELKFDMPGVQKDQVKIEVDAGILTVSAERKEEKRSDGEKTYSSEIFYGSYTRSLSLPSSVDEKKIVAKFSDGVLSITIPKTEVTEAKRIAVQ